MAKKTMMKVKCVTSNRNENAATVTFAEAITETPAAEAGKPPVRVARTGITVQFTKDNVSQANAYVPGDPYTITIEG